MAHKVIHITKEQIQSAIEHTTSMRKASIFLGVPFDTFRRNAKAFGLYKPARTPSRKTLTFEFVEECIRSSRNMAEAAAKSGRHYKAFERHAKSYGLWNPNIRFKHVRHSSKTKFSLQDILEGKHPTYNCGQLKKRILEAGLLKFECAVCSLTEWNGTEAPLQLDHINGVRTDHRLVNLRLLCPNCHAQTDTFCGRNIKH